MGESLDSVVEAVRTRVEPDTATRDRLGRVADRVVERTRQAIADRPVSADVIRVGSTARDTWMPDDRDIDIFVRFPPSLSRDELERHGLEIGRTVLPDGREEFAEHPYVSGTVDGFDIDLVPCYRVDAATETQSAVDRTPFHTAYISDVLTPRLASDVRVAKQFLRGCGIYGSDLKTRGFSGYLTELLVVEFDGFVPFVRAVADWHPPVRIDPGDHGRTEFDDSLVVIDPTDPDRNVAAVLTGENLARLQHHARRLVSEPSRSIFFPDVPESLDESTIRSIFEDRGTHPIAIRFTPPSVVPDQLYPQLEKSATGIGDELVRRGFDTVRYEYLVDDERATAVFLFELAVPERPAIERHLGPPVHVRDHAEAFFTRYADDETVYGPYIEGDRYVVERPRDTTTAANWLRSDAIFTVALGPDITSALAEGYDVLEDADVASLADNPTFARGLTAYLDPRPCRHDHSDARS